MIEELLMPEHDVVVIGASAGGVEALSRLVGMFPPDLPASVFVVLHVPAESTSVLPRILNRAGPLPVIHPISGQAFERGHIYVAPPDHHLLVKQGYCELTRGPRENGHRPAVDPLFRSAARVYGARVIGVILSGALDDGTAGMVAIQMRKGICVVQSPDDALYAGMPQSAIDNVKVDHVIPLAEMGNLLVELAHTPVLIESAEPDAEFMDM